MSAYCPPAVLSLSSRTLHPPRVLLVSCSPLGVLASPCLSLVLLLSSGQRCVLLLFPNQFKQWLAMIAALPGAGPGLVHCAAVDPALSLSTLCPGLLGPSALSRPCPLLGHAKFPFLFSPPCPGMLSCAMDATVVWRFKSLCLCTRDP